MKKTDKKILEEIIRVDHAGERGAIKIYEGQLLALNTISCKNVSFRIFGFSLAAINTIFSLILSVIFIKLFMSYGKN